MGQIVSFSMAEMCGGQNSQFQHGWNVTWSELLISTWLKCDVVKLSVNSEE
jgi:hypothetical protein